jgi:diaminopimelate decarboxylase
VNLPAPVRDLAASLAHDEAGLPAYVYDLTGLDAHVRAIRAALPTGTELYYAVKANPDPAVLRTVARHTDGLEVSSAGELGHAAAAVPGAALAFGGPGKTAADLATAVRAGVSPVHVESPHELPALAAAARATGRPVDVLFRANPPATGPGPGAAVSDMLLMGATASPFGMDEPLLEQAAQLLTGTGLPPGLIRLRGLHAHLASGLDAAGALRAAREVLDFGRRWCARHGVTRPGFTLGGGMAVDYSRPAGRFNWAEYGRGLAGLARAGEAQGETLRIEPGRAVTAYCGWYLTRVLDVKHSYGQAFAVVAGGTHHLRTPAAKGHSQPCAVIPVGTWPHPWPRPEITGEPVTIAGQLCTPKDVLARDLPVARLRAGDLVAFGLAGAYAWNISHHEFLMHPPPAFCYLETDPHPPHTNPPDSLGLPNLRRDVARAVRTRTQKRGNGHHCRHGARARRLRPRRRLPRRHRVVRRLRARDRPGLAAGRTPRPVARGGHRRPPARPAPQGRRPGR